MLAVTWALPAGGGGPDFAHAVSTLADGSSIVVGSFEDTAVLDGVTLSAYAGSRDIFIAKLDPNGFVRWVKTAGGNNLDQVMSVATLADGSSIVTGQFQGFAMFQGAATGGNPTVTSSSEFEVDMFVAKFDPNGFCVWATAAGGPLTSEYGYGISTLADGSAIVTGTFAGTVTFGGTTLTSSGSGDAFIAKVSPTGTFAWAVRAGGSAFDNGRGVSSLADGSVIVTGSFQGTASFGGTTLTSSAGYDIFVAKLNPTGTFAWAVRAGGSGEDYSTGVSTLADGSAMVTGSFQGVVAFGSATLSSIGTSDVFVAKINPAGTFAWAGQAGVTTNGGGNGIQTLADGTAIVAGFFQGTVTIDGVTFTSNGYDAFVAKVSPSSVVDQPSISIDDLPATGLPTGQALRSLGTGLVSKFKKLASEQSAIQKRYAKSGISWPSANPQLSAASKAFSTFYNSISPVLAGKRTSVSVGNGAIFGVNDVEKVERLLSYIFRSQPSASGLSAFAAGPRAQQQNLWDILLTPQPLSKAFDEFKGLVKEKIDATWQSVKDQFTEGAKVVTGIFSGGSAAAVTEQVRNSIANTPGSKGDLLKEAANLRGELIESQAEKFDALTSNATGTASQAVARLEELMARGGDIDNILLQDIVRLDAVGRNDFATGAWYGQVSRDGITGDIFIRFKTQGTKVTGTISHTFYEGARRSRTTGKFEGVVEADGSLRGSALVRNSSGAGLFSIQWGPLFSSTNGEMRPLTSFEGMLYQEDRIQFRVSRR